MESFIKFSVDSNHNLRYYVDTYYERNTVKKTVCVLAPFSILFTGLTPGYVWAIPLAIGLFVIIGILVTLDALEN